jgi:hypothetical protein
VIDGSEVFRREVSLHSPPSNALRFDITVPFARTTFARNFRRSATRLSVIENTTGQNRRNS